MIKLKSILKEIEYPLAKGTELTSYRDYVGWKGKIIWMTPDKFLQLAPPLLYPFHSSFDYMKKRIKEKLPLDPLILWVDPQIKTVISHEGRHRATIAKQLGIEKVPVMIVVNKWIQMGKRVPKWTGAQHAFIDKADFKPQR